jgi:hypothetical protein
MVFEQREELPNSREIPTVNLIRPLIIDIGGERVLLEQQVDLRSKERKPDNNSALPWELPRITVEVIDLGVGITIEEIWRQLGLQVEVGDKIKEQEEVLPSRTRGQTRFRTITQVCHFKEGDVRLDSLKHQEFEWVELDAVFDRPLDPWSEDALREYLSLRGN